MSRVRTENETICKTAQYTSQRPMLARFNRKIMKKISGHCHLKISNNIKSVNKNATRTEPVRHWM